MRHFIFKRFIEILKQFSTMEQTRYTLNIVSLDRISEWKQLALNSNYEFYLASGSKTKVVDNETAYRTILGEILYESTTNIEIPRQKENNDSAKINAPLFSMLWAKFQAYLNATPISFSDIGILSAKQLRHTFCLPPETLDFLSYFLRGFYQNKEDLAGIQIPYSCIVHVTRYWESRREEILDNMEQLGYFKLVRNHHTIISIKLTCKCVNAFKETFAYNYIFPIY